jgi:hypothetical protein
MPLKPINIISPLSLLEEIPTDGNSPIKVIGSDYNVYAVKNSKSKKPSTDIINELLAHYFLTLWGISTPDIALMKITPAMLLPEFTDNHRPHYYKHEVFCSKWIPNSIDSSEMFQINNKNDYQKFTNPEVLFEIGLFDIWVENDDRKPTNHNLLIHFKDDTQCFVPIDHSFIFGSVNYLDLDPDLFSPIDNENIFISKLGKSLMHYIQRTQTNWLHTREKFYLCVEACRQNFDFIVAQIPQGWGFNQEHRQKLYDFLFNEERNQKVYNEFQYKLRK